MTGNMHVRHLHVDSISLCDRFSCNQSCFINIIRSVTRNATKRIPRVGRHSPHNCKWKPLNSKLESSVFLGINMLANIPIVFESDVYCANNAVMITLMITTTRQHVGPVSICVSHSSTVREKHVLRQRSRVRCPP